MGRVSHPSDKNKDVARMGHPRVVLNGAKADPSLRLKNGYGQDDTAIFCGRTKSGRANGSGFPPQRQKQRPRKEGAPEGCAEWAKGRSEGKSKSRSFPPPEKRLRSG